MNMRKKMGISRIYTHLYTLRVDELYTSQIALLMHELNCYSPSFCQLSLPFQLLQFNDVMSDASAACKVSLLGSCQTGL